MCQRVVRRHGRQPGRRPAAEGTSGARQQQLFEGARRGGADDAGKSPRLGRGRLPASAPSAGAASSRVPGRRAGRDALVQRAVLAVHRQDGRARTTGQLKHERPPGDHALLVGQRQRGAGLERRDGGAQPGRADNGVEHDERYAGGGRPLGGGRHKYNAGGGNDKVYGGPKDDIINGGRGNDRVFGGGGTFQYNREVPDQCNIIADYRGGPSVVMTNSLSNHVPADTVIRGTDGIITWAMLQGGVDQGVRIVPFAEGKKEIRMPWKGQGDTSKLWTESLFKERGVKSVLAAHAQKIEEGKLYFETITGEEGVLDFDFAMLLPPFRGQDLQAFDKDGTDITGQVFAPSGFLKVDADYTPKPYEEWKASDWPSTYVSPAYANVFACLLYTSPSPRDP